MNKSIFFAFALLTAVGCGGPQEFVITGTSRALQADGLITVSEIEGNRLVEIEMENLTPPSRYDGATVYVVWFKAPNQEATMAGSLEFDEDDRTGQMRATTPLSRFEVLITAEQNTSRSQPSETVIATQRVGEAN